MSARGILASWSGCLSVGEGTGARISRLLWTVACAYDSWWLVACRAGEREDERHPSEAWRAIIGAGARVVGVLHKADQPGRPSADEPASAVLVRGVMRPPGPCQIGMGPPRLCSSSVDDRLGEHARAYGVETTAGSAPGFGADHG